MALPESGLAKTLIQQAYEGSASGRLPWEDESGLVADSQRYAQYFQFIPGQTLKMRRTLARSWLFLESFEWFFGRKAMADKTAILDQAMTYVEGLPEKRQFICPLEYQQKVFKELGAEMSRKLPAMPEKPRAKFVWYLRLTMPGWYSWAPGRSEAFTRWVLDGTTFPPDATLNCWEMVFFAAVNAGLLTKETLAPAYRAEKGSAEQVLFETFKKEMVEYKTSANQPVFEAGDIVISSLGGPFQHVFAVAGQEKNIADLKVVQLWGSLGAGTTFYWTIGEFLALERNNPQSVYWVLKL